MNILYDIRVLLVFVLNLHCALELILQRQGFFLEIIFEFGQKSKSSWTISSSDLLVELVVLSLHIFFIIFYCLLNMHGYLENVNSWILDPVMFQRTGWIQEGANLSLHSVKRICCNCEIHSIVVVTLESGISKSFKIYPNTSGMYDPVWFDSSSLV